MREDVLLRRLDNLKQATILYYLDEVSFDNEKGLYDVMMKHFASGDLDKFFLSNSLYGLKESEYKEALNLVKKYQFLCFYLGDSSNWADSIGGVYLDNYSFICAKILDHFDFLLWIVKEKKMDVLALLEYFQKGTMTKKGSVIDYLRSSFNDDELLKSVLISMVSEEGEYHSFSNIQKEVLCRYPKGTLYLEENGKKRKNDVSNLLKKLGDIYSLDKDSFEDTVSSISYDFCSN